MPAYSSSEAAQMLSIAPITLRKLSIAFAAWLSPSAVDTMMIDVTWDQLYNDNDLDTLRYIITLLKQKRNYAWVGERLTIQFGAGDLAQRHAELPQRLDPVQPPHVVAGVEPMPGRRPLPGPQQPDLVEVVQRPDGQAGPCRQLAHLPPRFIHFSTLGPHAASGSSLGTSPCASLGAPSRQGRKLARYWVGVRPVSSRNAALNADSEV